MSIRRAAEADADYLARTTHKVEAPDRYEDWRTYAFSNAPELRDSEPAIDVTGKADPTV
jgi:hypothetical protein